MTDSNDLKDLFEKAQAELITAQAELSALAAAAAADPWLETQQQASRDKLNTTRDAMLQQWARLGLSWLLRGGEIQLTSPEGQTSALSAPRPAQPAPVAAANQATQGGFNRRAPIRNPTVVNTLRRGTARPEVVEYAPPRSSTWRRPAPVINDLDADDVDELFFATGLMEVIQVSTCICVCSSLLSSSGIYQ